MILNKLKENHHNIKSVLIQATLPKVWQQTMCVIITDSKDLCQLEPGIRNQTQVLKSCTQMWGADNQCLNS